MENERNKKQETVPTPADDDDKGIDTNAFLMTEMKWFLPFTVRCLWGTARRLQRDLPRLLPFTDVGDATLNLILGSWSWW